MPFLIDLLISQQSFSYSKYWSIAVIMTAVAAATTIWNGRKEADTSWIVTVLPSYSFLNPLFKAFRIKLEVDFPKETNQNSVNGGRNTWDTLKPNTRTFADCCSLGTWLVIWLGLIESKYQLKYLSLDCHKGCQFV